MIVLRSSSEIELIRQAGRIVAAAIEKVRSEAMPGVTTALLDRIARSEILKLNGYPAFKDYKGYPGNICASVNEEVVHGIPSGRKLRDGDIVGIDVGVRFRDYFADGAVTLAIGKVSQTAQNLIMATEEALEKGIAEAVCGNRLSDVSHAIQAHAESRGYSVVRAFVGHGIGTKIHEDPEIPNYGKPDRGPRLERGMVLALEPMINAGTYEVEIMDDGWTAVTKDRKLSAHFEHTIAVTDGAADILTKL